jgi:hypothetical protein
MSYTPPVGIATTTRPGLVQLSGDLGGAGTRRVHVRIEKHLSVRKTRHSALDDGVNT